MKIGDQVGNWTIQRLLQSGPNGEVFYGERPGAVDPVAIYLMPKGRRLTDESVSQYRRLARSSGASCVPAFRDLGRWAGREYYVTAFADGFPVQAWAIECALPLMARLELFERVCRAVETLHDRGMTHGSLSPQRVLITKADEIKFLGFERWAGDDRKSAGVTSDVAGLGSILHGLIHHAQPGESLPDPRVVAATMRMRPRWLRQIRRRGLDEIINAAVAMAPRPTYQNATSLRLEIGQLRQGLPPLYSRPSGLRDTVARNWFVKSLTLLLRKYPASATAVYMIFASVLMVSLMEQRVLPETTRVNHKTYVSIEAANAKFRQEWRKNLCAVRLTAVSSWVRTKSRAICLQGSER